MVDSNQEKITIAVVGRDRFTPTEKCLETLFQNTTQPFEFILVLGGAPKSIQENLKQKYASRGKIIFKDEFLNPAQGRNIALAQTCTRLAVLMDNDCNVRPGWLTPLLECQSATQAAMVVPLILEEPTRIHTAGNDLYITYDRGKAYGHKELRFHAMVYNDSSNLKRQPTDYGELHCQLVDVPTAKRLNVYDEKIREVGECDAGLSWQKAGCSMWFEPKSVVYFEYPKRIDHVADIRYFAWRWDMRAILRGYRHFRDKWKIDISENGHFSYFLSQTNHRLGLMPRVFPCRLTLLLDHRLNNLSAMAERLLRVWRRLKSSWMGYDEWMQDIREQKK